MTEKQLFGKKRSISPFAATSRKERGAEWQKRKSPPRVAQDPETAGGKPFRGPAKKPVRIASKAAKAAIAAGRKPVAASWYSSTH